MGNRPLQSDGGARSERLGGSDEGSEIAGVLDGRANHCERALLAKYHLRLPDRYGDERCDALRIFHAHNLPKQ